jgi:hypothetical protein
MKEVKHGNARAAVETGSGLGILVAAVLGGMALVDGGHGNGTSGAEHHTAQPPAASAPRTHKAETHKPTANCHRDSGILRIVGINSGEAKDISKVHLFSSPLNSVPGMLDERHDPRDKNVNLTSAELRIKPGALDVSDTVALQNATYSHFNNDPTIKEKQASLLPAGSSATHHEYGINSGTIAEIVEYGTATVCQ